MQKRCFSLLFLFLSYGIIAAGKWLEDELPIVVVHDIMSEAMATHDMKKRFVKGGIKFYAVEIGNRGLDSIPMQGKKVFDVIGDVAHRTGKKVNIICHSQGNIATRYAVQHFQNPNNPLVNNIIGLAGPNTGVYDLPGNFDEGLGHVVNDTSISCVRRMMRKAVLGWAYFGIEHAIEHVHKLFYISIL